MQMELFDITVTTSDIESWLLNVPRFDGSEREQLIENYIRDWDVVNKVKREKLINNFYGKNTIDKFYLSFGEKISRIYRPKYKQGSPFVRYGDLVKRLNESNGKG